MFIELKLYYDTDFSFGNYQLKGPTGMLLSTGLCTLLGLIYNACQLDLAGILMLEM